MTKTFAMRRPMKKKTKKDTSFAIKILREIKNEILYQIIRSSEIALRN